MAEIHFENRDCVEAMKEFPDNFFDLAIVDPPYGDGSQTVNVERERAYNRFGGRFDRYKSIVQAEHGAQNTVKKSSRGMLPRRTIILKNCSASHAIKSFGAETISVCLRHAASWFGGNRTYRPKTGRCLLWSMRGHHSHEMRNSMKCNHRGRRTNRNAFMRVRSRYLCMRGCF